ncbi:MULTISPECIES: PadR family transcriptional regulator [Micromonospora]|uniref:Transcriptional regulator, PadR family n=1 Tax=Micromonospora yangpuensis TaxID=683228 RepID=A0A1C6UMT4_9ACTN|nr:PadR family transcriptional regulator [Micromonospora yangpuensis]GGM27861.1 PadR family transcriptional regulator [Micromonospora yangpuensis]SCL55223.1 transcriptional regulator, PadR family [Micromonospora yangpuensis]
MSVRLALLGLLHGQPSHGYRLKHRYDTLVDPDAAVAPAQIYATLARLERDGLVRQAGVDQDSGPARRMYELTSVGRDEVVRWLTTPVEPAPHLQTLLYTKVVVTVLTGRSVEPLIDAQREAHLARMRELTGLRRSRDRATCVLAEYALQHLEADLRWLEVVASQGEELVEGITESEEHCSSPA